MAAVVTAAVLAEKGVVIEEEASVDSGGIESAMRITPKRYGRGAARTHMLLWQVRVNEFRLSLCRRNTLCTLHQAR